MGLYRYIKGKQLHHWLGGYLQDRGRRRVERVRTDEGRPRHLLFCFCDHWEPLWGDADDATGDARVRAWHEGYPALASGFRDADGRAPQHSFFFPGEQYRPHWLDALGDLSRRKLGEVELHLHHDGDTAESLRRDIGKYLGEMSSHGHFSRGPAGEVRYGFIHGNWCLANSADDGRMCGVDEEIPLLFDTGCYADFTFPAPESEAQPNIVNSIYWPIGNLHARRAYEMGQRAEKGSVMNDRILMIEGPTSIGLVRRKMPVQIEMADITAHNPATPARIARWVESHVVVGGQPDWVFVKVHTHGAPEAEAASLLGEAGRKMHEELAARYNDGVKWALHYVTAREMFNVAIAAMEGKTGDPGAYRDHVLPPPPVRA